MLLADFYVQQLKRQQASKIELISNEPIRFSLASGDRQANAPISHDQIVQLIQEIADVDAMEQLSATREGRFGYPRRDPDTSFHVKIIETHKWHVVLSPAGQAAAASPQASAEPVLVGRGGRGGLNSAVAAPDAMSSHDAPNPTVTDSFSAAIIDAPAEPSLGGGMGQGLTGQRPAVQSEARASFGAPQTPAPQSAPPQVPPMTIAAEASSFGAAAAPAAQAPQQAEQPQVAPPAVQAAPAAPQVLPSDEPRLNYYLRKMIDLGASDLHMSAGMPPLVRLDGEMDPLEAGSPALSNDELSDVLFEVLEQDVIDGFKESWDLDFAHAIEGCARFRANYFMDQNGVGAVFRQIPFEILTPEQIGLPEQVLDLCWLSKGLVLVTGPTGSGKSTTLASMIDYINRNRKDHIITIEDPVEFVHPNKQCLVNQREVGTHTKGFKAALKAALREDPDIVLVGEMRDLETIAIAIETAETGHLVFGTLHTTTAPSTVDRLIDQFPADQQAQIRTMLSESLKGVVAQVLCKAKPKGRAAAYEILIANSAISNNIREGKTHQLVSIMQTGKKEGMCTMNDSLLELVVSGRVDAKEAYIKSVDKQGLKMMFQSKGIQLDLGDLKE